MNNRIICFNNSKQMKFTTSLFISSVLAQSDLDILNYALTLEHLENAFYQQGVANFTAKDFEKYGMPNNTFSEFQVISSHEKIHVDTLVSVINASYPGKFVPPCNYSFGITTVSEFVEIARALERTGVSAYLGRVADINLKAYLTAAATITTIEARHASFLNIISGISGMPQPFDTPLDPTSIVSIASQFIVSCPYDLGVKPYPKFNVKVNGMSVYTESNSTGFCKFLYGANTKYSSIENGKCELPSDAKVDVYVFNVQSNSSDSKVLAGPAIVSAKMGEMGNIVSSGINSQISLIVVALAVCFV